MSVSSPRRIPTEERTSHALDEVLAVGKELPRGQRAAFLGELERIRVEILLDTSVPPPAPQGPPEVLILTPEQAARFLGRSVSWIYKNKASLPVVGFPTGGWGLNARKLEQWINRRTR